LFERKKFMKKSLFILMTLFAVILVSCGSPAAPIEATAVPSETTTPVAVPTLDPAQPAAVVTSSGPAVCKAGSDPLPLPEITEEDWRVGPSDAKITILEYSDYQ
jgi:hypothetical protein